MHDLPVETHGRASYRAVRLYQKNELHNYISMITIFNALTCDPWPATCDFIHPSPNQENVNKNPFTILFVVSFLLYLCNLIIL